MSTPDTIRPAVANDVLRWPDGTWMYRTEYVWAVKYRYPGAPLRDDYEVFTPEHPEYNLIVGLETV